MAEGAGDGPGGRGGRGGRGGHGGHGGGHGRRGSASDLTRLARGGALNLMGAVTNGLLAFVQVIIIARGFSTSVAGLFFQASALFMLMASVAELGGDTGLVRAVSRERALDKVHELRRTLAIGLTPAVVFATAIAVALYVEAPRLSNLLVGGAEAAEGSLVPFLRILAPVLPLAVATNLALAATRGFGTMLPTVALLNIARPAMATTMAFGVVLAGLGSTYLALSSATPVAVVSVATFLWLLAILRRAERRWPADGGPVESLRAKASAFWRFATPRGVATIFNVALYRLDTLMLGALHSSRHAAIYVASTRLITFGGVALIAIQSVIAPQISATLARGERERARVIYMTATGWLMALSWPILLAVATFAPVPLRLFGPQYAEGQVAVTLLAVASLASMAAGPCSVVLVMAGRSGIALANSAGVLVINVALNIWLIPKLGLTGAGISWAVALLLNNVAALIQVKMFVGMHPFGPGPLAVAVVAGFWYGVLGLVSRLVFGESLPVLLVYIVVATAGYAATLWRFRVALRVNELVAAARPRWRASEPPQDPAPDSPVP